MSAEGAKIEAPQAPRGVGAGRGVPLPLGEESGEEAVPLPVLERTSENTYLAVRKILRCR